MEELCAPEYILLLLLTVAAISQLAQLAVHVAVQTRSSDHRGCAGVHTVSTVASGSG